MVRFLTLKSVHWPAVFEQRILRSRGDSQAGPLIKKIIGLSKSAAEFRSVTVLRQNFIEIKLKIKFWKMHGIFIPISQKIDRDFFWNW